MVKVKNKKNFGLADKLHAKKSNAKLKTKLNPFEVHINREKYNVLGKKSKNDWGLPGVSRAKALKKRKNTIGHELKLANKTNTFLDKRIGEKNVALSEEDKVMARFAAERIQQHKMKSDKQSIYNLADEEILTHRGQTLEEIEKFDDPRSDDENDEDSMMYNKSGNLKDDFVADANFGGGVLSRNEARDGAKSRKDLIEQLILESKKRKVEKQKLKEETLDLTEKLDSEWKDLQPIVSKDFNKEVEKMKQDKPEPIIDKVMSEYEKKNEDYNKIMRELKFEPRGTPSDRLKSEDEIAKIEKDRLEKLEQDRLKRMQGFSDMNKSQSVPKHKSADGLDYNFAADSDEELALVYDAKGNAVMKENSDKDNSEEDASDGESVDDNENEDEGECEDDSGEETEDSLDDLKAENDMEQSSDEENDFKNVQTKCDKNDDITTSRGKKTLSKDKIHIVEETGKSINGSDPEANSIIENVTEDSHGDKIKSDLLARKAMMEKAAAELPYMFEMPKDYDSLHDLLTKHPPDYQNLIIERMIKCNHPKLCEENKAKLGTLFAYMLQYLNDLFSQDIIQSNDGILNSFRCFDRLACHFYDLAQMDPTNAKNCIQEVLIEKYEDYKKSPKVFPHLDSLIFFKLVSLLFPTSDSKHPIVTPCYSFMSQILTNCKVRKSSDVAKGLFVTTLVLEYVALSKRILPDAINFIRGVLFLTIPTDLEHKFKVLYPFKKFGPLSNLLVLQNKIVDSSNSNWKLNASDLIDDTNTDNFKVAALGIAVKLFEEFFKQAEELCAREAMYSEHLKLLKLIPLNNYSKYVVLCINSVLHSCDECIRKQQLKPIVENKKPKTLKLYEPAFDTQFSGRKKKNLPKEKIEHEKLIHKHKKEMKGALREIRRDKTYISSVKIKEKIQSDNVRKDKVKRIYSEASVQQGELNALQRSKKKMK